MDNLSQFIEEVEQKHERIRQKVKNNEIFDFNYTPKNIFLREEAKLIVENILSFQAMDVPNNMFIYGARGSGKTVLLKYLAAYLTTEKKLSIPVKFVNCRHNNTTLKILAELLGIDEKGLGAAELYHKLIKTHDRLVIILDEIDLMSRSNNAMDILYCLSRAEKKYMVILLSNSPGFYRKLDESTKSSLQLENLYFKNYDGEEIMQILKARCEEGLITGIEAHDLARIASLTHHESNGDIRIALKALQYLVTGKHEDIGQNFNNAKKDMALELLANQTDQVILILKAAVESPCKLAKSVYSVYSGNCKESNIKAFTYQHFYNHLGYLQNTGLIMLVSTRQRSGNPNKIETLFDSTILSQIYQYRFA